MRPETVMGGRVAEIYAGRTNMYRQSHAKTQVRSDLGGWKDGWGTARRGQKIRDCGGDAEMRWVRKRQTLNGDREVQRNNVSPGSPASSIESPRPQSELRRSPTGAQAMVSKHQG